MSSITTEPRVTRAVRVSKRRARQVQFYALDGTFCMLLDAESEAEARDLCRELQMEFISLCTD